MRVRTGRADAPGSDYTISFDPEFDGARLEAGIGLSYILNERSQLYLDYEYSKADTYKRPWSASLGFRYLW